MGNGTPPVGLDEATYFINVAVIAGALIGLTFIALQLFMVDMLTRFETSAFPVFRSRENRKLHFHPISHDTPAGLTDAELLDGDPLVVFMAFSIAVSWCLFLLPLLIGLTAAWDKRPGLLAIEMFGFSVTLLFNFRFRSRKVNQLNPYLTREELLWPLISGAAFVLYVITALALLATAFPAAVPHRFGSSSWIWFGFSYGKDADSLLKISCIASLILGTYTVNKDMFIFFKSAAAERMRRCWLQEFISNIYPNLATRIRALRTNMPVNTFDSSHLARRWRHGPASISTHDSFSKAESQSARRLWMTLISSGSDVETCDTNTQLKQEVKLPVPVWLLDVPAIARWVSDVERELIHAESS